MSVLAMRKTVKFAEAAARLQLNREQVGRLVRKGSLGVVKYPGLRPMVLLDDVERLIANSVVPASK